MFNIKNKNILITGATSGIGRSTVLALSSMGASVTFIARNKDKAEILLKELNTKSQNKAAYILADLSSQKEVKSAAKEYLKMNRPLDILINNAGLINLKRRETIDGFEETFAVNHLAYFSLTNLLIDKLKESESARIINISSGAHQFVKRMNFDDIQSEKNYKPFKVYSYSKLANILFTRKLSEILKDDNITVNCLHPGVVATGFASQNDSKFQKFLFKLSKPFMRSSNKGAETSIYLSSSDDVSDVSGKYFYNSKVSKISSGASNEEDTERLWRISMELTELV
ncbi:MAG: SDR family oxidoreductase [Hyphomicrobiales bacterium]|jgi:NAD(P)-dependent dehydrogenase (short-subunit alcohol dehydrogenase family)|nr:SDR family oxidoreductase [Alphaproteobacteria bacterium]MDG1153083.1 SDR family oxidoreductase [Hyphomicrobiales bacterium]MBT4911342.1 SDR family oxidoreductase [Alphaproteobacteria bacterium]MBT5663251.1 SDR family oxidoreductase [Alphaproteobacteria bacterium]MDG1523878.1 SDR family oxidoreductase [Hyphomicrobiales bacterium]|tara:strand:+ start:2289 stop:3140 length:852 start_codon:yes stop_codon:yes gene_type:complete